MAKRNPERDRPADEATDSATPAPPGPIIILGSQRSGTTEMSRLFTKVLGYAGEGEGHLWPAIMMAWQELDTTVKKIGGVKSKAYSQFTIGRFGVGKVKRRLSSALAAMYEEELGPKWVDKTPGVQMVRAAPMLKDALPGVRFVFMHRRGIENVLSKQRRFPNRPFARACEEWGETMSAWLDVRDSVAEQSIEIDQMTMATVPDQTARDLCAFLGEDGEVETAVRAYLSETRSEQTSAVSAGQAISLSETNWSAEQVRIFCDKCAPMMAMFGYQMDGAGPRASDTPMAMPLMFTRSANVEVASESGKTAFRWGNLRISCLNQGTAEKVRMLDISTSGQNTFEATVRVGGVEGVKNAMLDLAFQRSGAKRKSFELILGSGTEQELMLDLGDLDGPLTIEVCAVATGPAEGFTNLSLVRPRLTYRAPVAAGDDRVGM
ncbi:MAG: sulfotransferase [Caulobacteraceae bacterium]